LQTLPASQQQTNETVGTKQPEALARRFRRHPAASLGKSSSRPATTAPRRMDTLRAMSDDWRVQVHFEEESGARELVNRLDGFELAHHLKTAFRDRVVVSRDGPVVFCYTDGRDQAEAAAQAIDELAARHEWHLTRSLERWHPEAEQWVQETEPLPDTPAQREHEHAERIESERRESQEQGFPMFEVRVKCPSHADALELAERLEAEGIPTAHRWWYVLVGANDEDAAASLAERIRGEAPAGSDVEAWGSPQEIIQDAPPGATPFITGRSPFAVFGWLPR
jgi:hypothetical protein